MKTIQKEFIQKILTYTIVGGLFLVPFISFIVSSNMFFPFITGKGFAFRILVEILFGMYFFLALLEPAYRPRKSWITYSVLIFSGVTLRADIFGANVYKSIWSNYERMEGFVLIAHLALYYIVVSNVLALRNGNKLWNYFWNISILASAIMSGYGVLQLMGKININQGGVRLDATFGNSAYLAIYLVLHIFLCLYMIFQRDSATFGVVASSTNSSKKLAWYGVWYNWIYGGIALLEVIILYYTATRGAILGLIGGIFLAALLVLWKGKRSGEKSEKGSGVSLSEIENKTARKSAYATVIAILVLVLVFVALHNTSFVKNSPVLSRFSSISASELTSQGRYYVWPMALKGIVERPLLGWGQEGFNFVFNKNYNPKMYGQEQWFDRTHDVVLDWMIAGGLLGFLAYASLYVFLLYYIWRKESLLSVTQKSILTGMLTAYVFHNIFVFDNLVSYILFFSVLGYVDSMSHGETVVEKNVKGEVVTGGVFYTRAFSSDALLYIAAPLVVLATLGTVYFVNIPAIQTSITLIQAITPQKTGGAEQNLALFKKAFAYNSFGSPEVLEQLIQVSTQISVSSGVPDSVKAEFYDFTKLKIEEKIKQTPTDARYLVFAGSFFNRFAQYDLAVEYLTNALKYSPKKQSIYFELGTSYLGKKDYQKAFELFKTAYELEPSYTDAKIIYTLGALYTKNGQLARQLLSTIDQNLIINDNRFLRTYADIGDYQSVIAILSARIQKDPTNLQYQLSLASAYATIGDKARAIAIIQAMEKEQPTFKAQGDQYIQQIQSAK